MTAKTVSKHNRTVAPAYRKVQLKAFLTLLWLRVRHPLAPLTVYIPSYISKQGCYYISGCEYVQGTIIIFTTAK